MKRLEKKNQGHEKGCPRPENAGRKNDRPAPTKKLEKEHDKKMMKFFETRKQVDEKSDELLEEIEAKLKLSHTADEVFTICWHLN